MGHCPKPAFQTNCLPFIAPREETSVCRNQAKRSSRSTFFPSFPLLSSLPFTLLSNSLLYAPSCQLQTSHLRQTLSEFDPFLSQSKLIPSRLAFKCQLSQRCTPLHQDQLTLQERTPTTYQDYMLHVVQLPSSLLLHRRKWLPPLLPRLLASQISHHFDRASLYPQPLLHQQRSPCSWSALLLAKLLLALLPSSPPSFRRRSAQTPILHILPCHRRRTPSTQRTKQFERPDLPFDQVIPTIPNLLPLYPTIPLPNRALPRHL